ncbi:hypothetical protein D0Z07_6030 [Hyphodiscus hymeniophilus]|uniref:Uncharacterized protein n=1 Tax=Hyphodiscus hymeniophilus TaxID=353542 RepID=A0A9P6VHN8_9HELO|nr:hypothetical protein D0Z07_6030 [Hyphodiscus hymeniophilus]
MSFGFSVGDFIAVGQLAWQIYGRCKKAPADFKAISTQLISLHIVIKDVNETIEEWDLPDAKKYDLLRIGEGSKDTLDELDQLLRKYSGLGMKGTRTMDRLRFPRAETAELKSRLESYITMLTSFKTSLVLSSQARLEKMVSQIIAERQAGLREDSVISPDSIASTEDGDEDTWLAIKRELEDYGTITDTVLNEHRGLIIDLLKTALAEGGDGQSALPDHMSEVEHCEVTYEPSDHTAAEIIAAVKTLALTEGRSQSDIRSIHGADDDISEYLVDDLHDALSFYEMFYQQPNETFDTSQEDLILQLHLLGRKVKVLQRLTSANAAFWTLALSETIREAEQALALTEPVVEHWFSNKLQRGVMGTWNSSIVQTRKS